MTLSLRLDAKKSVAAMMVVASTGACAQASRDFARMGTNSYAAFECSILAAHTKDIGESERLFNFGYREGKKFIAAYTSKKIDQKDLNAEVPWIFGTLLQGPTPDFMLGRVYESALEYALRDVMKTGEQMNPSELEVAIARNKYLNKNCRLLGHPK